MKFIMNDSNYYYVNPTVRYHVGCLPLWTKDPNSGFTVHDSHIFSWISGVDLDRVEPLFLYLLQKNIEWRIKWEANWATVRIHRKKLKLLHNGKIFTHKKDNFIQSTQEIAFELLVSLFLDKLISSVFSQHHFGWRPFFPSEPKRCSLLDLAFASKLG